MITAFFQTHLQKTIRIATLTLLGSATFLWLATPANAQAGPLEPISDRVTVSVNSVPFVDFSIAESQEGNLYSIVIPRTIIELTEPSDPGSVEPPQISDRLVIAEYTIEFQSDPPSEIGLNGRPDALPVSENFSPITLVFASDGEDASGTGGPSDFVDVLIAGALPLHFVIPELPPPGTTAPESLPPFSGGPYKFDMLESDGTVSDTLDIDTFSFTFESDGEGIGLEPIPHDPALDAYFSFPETSLDGSALQFHYSVFASSDTDVPEPTSVVLAGLALLGLAGLVRRR